MYIILHRAERIIWKIHFGLFDEQRRKVYAFGLSSRRLVTPRVPFGLTWRRFSPSWPLPFLTISSNCAITWCQEGRDFGRFGICLRACFVKASERVNRTKQTGHWNGFPSVCTLRWRDSSSGRANRFSQFSHVQLYSRSVQCVPMCCCRCDFLL